MRVIFVDVDGVLNTPSTWGHRSLTAALEAPLVMRLANLVKEAKSFWCLSSTWRLGKTGLTDTLQAFEQLGWTDATSRCLGRTPMHPYGTRGDEIREWLYEHPAVTEFVIFDDDSDIGHEPLAARFIQIDPTYGLTDADCRFAFRLFQVGYHD